MKNFIKKNKYYILTVLIPMIIVLLIYITNKIYPFGDRLVAMIDGYGQYPGILSNFLNSIKGKTSLFYSLRGLLGFNSFPTFVYYTFNITSLVALLFKNLMTYYNFIVLIKICLCSLTMLIYLNYIKKRKINYMFAITYALSSYNLLFYFNYMWFDTIILFPLVMLGIEKIFKEDKYNYYLIFLTLSILFNFYIGYMVCIFSVIYFTYLSFTKGFNKIRLIKYLLYSLLSGLICGFALVPTVIEILNGKSDVISYFSKEYFKFDKDFINVFYKLTLASFSNGDLQYGTPNVYVSLFVYINALLYFFNKRINLKTRICSLVICLFFLLSFSFNLVDFFWHMMSKPIYYPVRYSFIFGFFLIYLAFRNFIRYDNKSMKFNLVFYIGLVIIIGIGFITAGNLVDKENIMAKLIYLGVSLVFILYYAFMLNSKDLKKYIVYILIIELSFNSYLCFKNNGNNTSFNTYTSNYNNVDDTLKLINDNDLYRIGVKDKSTNNNGLLIGYNELSYFSSVRNSNVFKYGKDLMGLRSFDDCNLMYYYNNPIVNSLLGVKYIISDSDLNYYEKLDDNLYFNDDATSFGFMVNSNIKAIDIKEDSFKDNINNLVKKINGNEIDILSVIEPKNKTVNCNKENMLCIFTSSEVYMDYEYTASGKEFIFINDLNLSVNDIKFILNGKEVNITSKDFILLDKNDKVNVKVLMDKKDMDYNVTMYRVDYNAYVELTKNVNKEKVELINYVDDSNFKFKVNVEENNLLYTSIAADNGWNVYVDGKKADYIKLFDAVIGLDLDEGTHEIEFKYVTPGLKEGIIISGISLIACAGLLIKNKIKQKM